LPRLKALKNRALPADLKTAVDEAISKLGG